MRFRSPSTLLFGRGRLADVPALLRELGAERPLVVTDPGVAAAGIAERLIADLQASGLQPGLWDGVAADPDETHAERCRDHIAAGGHRSVIALGGGSVIDVAKVAAVLATNGGRSRDYFGFDRVPLPGLPLLTVPTTPGSGAEVSSHAVLVQLAPRKKEVVAGLHLLPRAAVVDPDLTRTLPPVQTTWSALDGFIHAIEAFLARRASPFTDTLARQAVPLIARALPQVLADGSDLAARDELSLGCLYSGLAMANANAGAIHALGYPLTARYGIPHGLANALVAAAALERIEPGRPERCAELAVLLGDSLLSRGLDATKSHPEGESREPEGSGRGHRDSSPRPLIAERVRQFLSALRVDDRLSSWGVPAKDLPELADAAACFRPVLDNAPVALGRDDLLAVYRAAA